MAIDFSNPEFDPEELSEPLVTTSLTREDEGEYSLRPRTLREYIGQEKAKGNLEVFIQAAKMRASPWTRAAPRPPGPGQNHPQRHHRQRDGGERAGDLGPCH